MRKLVLVAAVLTASAGFAFDELSEYGDFGFFGFKISAGYDFGFGLKANLRGRTPSAIPSKAKAYARATGDDGVYSGDEGGFIVRDDGSGSGDGITTFWRMPEAAKSGTDGNSQKFTMHNAYTDGGRFMMDDDSYANGASVELSTTFARDRDWRIDFLIGFRWMTGIKAFESSGSSTSSIGEFLTTARVDQDDLYYAGYPDGNGMYGPGRPYRMGDGPAIALNSISVIDNEIDESTVAWNLNGDYNEYDIYTGFRLWYMDDDYQWLRFTSTLGVGASYGEFNLDAMLLGVDGTTLNASYKAADWNVHGLLGLGVMFNFWDIDLSFDCLWRFAQKSLNVDTPFVQGSIDRPDLILRVGLGYNF